MFKYLIVLSFVAGSLALAVPDRSLPQVDGRIVGGEATNIESVPWQVAILRNDKFHCGGVFYSNNIVLTAAHCIVGINGEWELNVVIGTSDWVTRNYNYKVKAVMSHEDYNPVTMENDIAVVRLLYTVQWTNKIKSIPLTTTPPKNGDIAVVSGWGSTAFGYDVRTDHLQSVAVKIIGNEQCGSYGYGDEIKKTMICASAPGKDACQGDTGGPLVSNGALIGIVSWGYGCAFANYPGVYTNVYMMRSWILNAVSKIP